MGKLRPREAKPPSHPLPRPHTAASLFPGSSSLAAPFPLQAALGLHPTPSSHEAMRHPLDRGQVTLPRPAPHPGAPGCCRSHRILDCAQLVPTAQMGKLRQGEEEHLAPGHTGRDEKGGSERLRYCPKSHSQSGKSWGATLGLLAPPLLRPLLSPRPRPLQNLLLLLWTLLNCGLGGNAQGPGEWTPWGSWSRCSSSCGRGLSVRSRQCIRFPREELCWGDTHEYRLCQLPECPPGAVPFRDLQCALYNGHPVLGTQKTYQWVPFYGAPNQCDLNCLAEGHDFYHSFGRVLDGTPCSPGTQGLCVAGRCLRAGCDGLLGSDAREDRCGRCGGANDSCLFVQRVFRDAGAFAGYWNVTLIPEGARHIRAAHRSRNHLALMGGDGRYVFNGNWAVSPPGTYEAAGTHVVYTRVTGSEETLRAAGPTSEDLLLQTPAHPALTPAVVPTGCSTIAAATLCSGPACWAASGRPRRPDMRCACSSSTRTARHCGPSSMCGRRAAAPAHRWPSIGTTCWRPGASSAPMALRTGCCSPMLATPGPGAPPRTAACAWPPDAAPSEPLDQTSATHG
ncbi:ADAMTS-like protein 5 isoform X6 [Sagmatias obliquidens]|uniref:ADAMTS-like protein 5 isoform X6 n=1 Tax=Tursiops truncatus TaxID=9739 RepID=A0A6J3R8M0_TURTR|nr:ADAMTS-like protein 5 isoform X6 [Lagenorhynchus obliquidens]XP_033710789.1 ADAMTS-like protein 5 isoform X6 [Tursiops truncatus]